MPEQNEPFVVKVLQRKGSYTTIGDYKMDTSGWEINQQGWLSEALRYYQRAAMSTPKSYADAKFTENSIQILSMSGSAWDRCNISFNLVDIEDIHFIFSSLETFLTQSQMHTSGRKHITSQNFRKFVFRYFSNTDNTSINKRKVGYHSQIPIPKASPRSVLNAEHMAHAASNSPPLGATPFSDFNNLVSNSLQKLREDLYRIHNACVTDLEAYAVIREQLNQIKKIPYLEEERKMVIKQAFATSTIKSVAAKSKNIPPKRLLSCWLNFIDEFKLHHAHARQFMKHDTDALLTSAGIQLPKSHVAKHIFGLPDRTSSAEMYAIMTILQCHTGWNINSLYNTTLDGIKPVNGGYELQGYKGKTDQKTPFSFVDPRNKEVLSAIKLLLWNHSQLIALGLIKKTEKKLWFCWTRCANQYARQMHLDQKVHKAFISRHNLFYYSQDQIRTQILNISQYEHRDIDTTRGIAGHRTIDTTGGYWSQFFSSNINSSISLDFQKRLEGKIIFNIKKKKKMNSDHSITLVPIGDGTSCIDPAAPPENLATNADGYCKALDCHKGEGCSYRRIVIDDQKLIEIARKFHYYTKNWKRLYAENPENFRKNIAPAMLFNQTIHDYIHSSAYGHTFEKIQKTLFSEQNGE